jgi:hypothetical protein
MDSQAAAQKSINADALAYHVADHRKAESFAHVLENSQGQIPALRVRQHGLAVVTTPGDEVEMAVAVVAF